MNILLDGGLPEEIGGYPIYPDFRNMIQFERALADEKLPDAAKVYAGFQLRCSKAVLVLLRRGGRNRS